MSAERPAKRIRQACEPCRRKKSRCPGEKPICSHCSRLRQNCVYAEETSQRNDGSNVSVTRVFQPRTPDAAVRSEIALEDRLRFVETQLAEVISNQSTTSRQLSRQISGSPSPLFQTSNQQSVRIHSQNLPPLQVILAAGESYLLYCDCQPLPLFHRESFIQALPNRDAEVQFAILALTDRFLDDPKVRGLDLVETSRAAVIQKVNEGSVELSTLQALVILTLVDFTNGNTKRASIHSSLAISLAHNAGLTHESHQNLSHVTNEEHRRCFWSLYLLKRLHGADFGVLDFADEDSFPWYPRSTGKPAQPDPALISNVTPHLELERGIISCEIQLSELWFKITRYARRRGKPSNLPPWSSHSEYAIIMAQQMESETRMPQVHRFKPAEFSKKSVEELQSNRDYWGPWIFTQFIYHTNLCLLNHPLLLSLRLKNIKSEIPEMFLQSTSDLISSHASWITHLIAMLEAKAFKVTDPFLAHCAAIVATIYLQESFVEENRREKMDSFATCLKFVQTFKEWPHVLRIAEKLEKLRDTVSSAYGIDPTRGLLIDLGQFWEILEYPSSSEVPGSQLFGSSLRSGLRGNITEMGHTSSLPQPTRVHAQDFAVSGSVNHSMEGQPFLPLLYSDDELAVLAESFFQQRPDEGMGDWWGTGSL